MYAINLDKDTNRILSACVVTRFTPTSMLRVNTLPDGDINEYRYVNGFYIHDPLPKEDNE